MRVTPAAAAAIATAEGSLVTSSLVPPTRATGQSMR